MTHLERARKNLEAAEKRIRFCKGQEIPHDEDPAEELCRLNRRREDVEQAEFEAEVLREYITKWETEAQ